MSEAATVAVSFAPDDFVAGGLIDDVNVEVEHAEFTKDPPEGYGERAIFLKMSLKDLDTGSIYEQWWSGGKSALDVMEPSPDGLQVFSTTGENAHFKRGSKLHTLMESLVAKGFPKTKCGSLANLRGLQMHMVQVPDKELRGLARPADPDRPRTTLVCDKILKLPGEKTKPAARRTVAAASASAEPAVKPAEGIPQEIDGLAVSTLRELLAAAGGVLETKMVRAKGFLAMKSASTTDRSAALNLMTNPAWLESKGFAYDPDTQSVIQA